MLKGQSAADLDDPSESTTSGYLEFVIEPPIEVLTALLLAFVLGLGIAAIKGDALLNMMNEFKNIIELVISKVIIPLLPFHIFANMNHSGTVTTIISVFLKVFVLIIILHLLYLLFIYFTAGTMSRQNPLQMLKTMSPAYFTALGTQSSAATIPVTLHSTKQ